MKCLLRKHEEQQSCNEAQTTFARSKVRSCCEAALHLHRIFMCVSTLHAPTGALHFQKKKNPMQCIGFSFSGGATRI